MKPDSADSERGRFVASVMARQLVAKAAGALAPAGIAAMPLKGALLQRVVYSDPAERALTDVDLLVPEESFEAATTHLISAGLAYEQEEPTGHRIFRDPQGLQLDLHSRLFPPGQFHLPTSWMFARSVRDDTAFGVPVRLPDPLDLYAHLLGHFALSFLYAGDVHAPGDFARVARHYGLIPARTVAHLRRARMDRAARWALPIILKHDPDPFARKVLNALGADPLGSLLAVALPPVVRRLRPASFPALVLTNLLHRSPAAQTNAAGHALMNRVKRWTRLDS